MISKLFLIYYNKVDTVFCLIYVQDMLKSSDLFVKFVYLPRLYQLLYHFAVADLRAIMVHVSKISLNKYYDTLTMQFANSTYARVHEYMNNQISIKSKIIKLLLLRVKVLYLQNDVILSKTSTIPSEVLEDSMIIVVFLLPF